MSTSARWSCSRSSSAPTRADGISGLTRLRPLTYKRAISCFLSCADAFINHSTPADSARLFLPVSPFRQPRPDHARRRLLTCTASPSHGIGRTVPATDSKPKISSRCWTVSNRRRRNCGPATSSAGLSCPSRTTSSTSTSITSPRARSPWSRSSTSRSLTPSPPVNSSRRWSRAPRMPTAISCCRTRRPARTRSTRTLKNATSTAGRSAAGWSRW